MAQLVGGTIRVACGYLVLPTGSGEFVPDIMADTLEMRLHIIRIGRCRPSEAMTGIFYAGLSDAEVAGFEATLEAILGNLVDHEERLSSRDTGEGRTK